MDNLNKAPDMMCALCQRPLNVFFVDGDPKTQLWQHGVAGLDHEPVPVPFSADDAVVAVCDFCSSDEVTWVFYTQVETSTTLGRPVFTGKTTSTPIARHWSVLRREQGQFDDVVRQTYSRGWAACGECGTFVDRRDMEGLITRLRRKHPEQFATVPRNRLRELYREVVYKIAETRRVDPETGKLIDPE